ncbi:uncharacterized protein OCT59_016993 [Rhizophagus irregularis]|uniref:uncharacterized protein n=1 Tax=Rhizophagus irregularis TaxID=588596 RepID=UPI0033189752|nr:hypothetical protein OCT59_016993 [Rhizophagus irregularis]
MDTKNYILVVKGDRSICVNCVRSVLSGWCKICSLNNLNNSKWTSGNNEIDRYIQEMQSKIDSVSDIIFEWIPYNQFIDIKKIVNESNILYSAKWKDGPIIYNKYKRKYKRNPNQEIVFKYYYNTQYIDELLSEARKNANIKGYVNSLEWIPYNQFIDVKELRKYEFSAAKWKNGQLNVEIILKYFCNIQNEDKFLYEAELYLANNSGSNEPKIYGISQNPDTKYYIMVFQNMHCKYCGEYLNHYRNLWCKSCQINFLKENFENFTNWTSGNKKVDDFIQEMQLKINDCGDIILEWIPYNQFIDVKELGKQDFSTVYLAKWKDGPLKYNRYTARYERNLNEVFTLKCFYNSQNMIDEFLYKAELYSIKVNCGLKILKIYGISQNPDTDDYIIVQNKSYECCEICDNILTDIQSKWYNSQYEFLNKILKTINKFDKYKINVLQIYGISQNPDTKDYIVVFQNERCTICAIWKIGPLSYDFDGMKYIREPCIKVALKYLNNSQNLTNEFLNEIKKYSTDTYSRYILRTYGISQDPNTKDYIMVLEYAEGGNFYNWVNKNYGNFHWFRKLNILQNIINGLKEIHQKGLVHRDFHTGNILLMTSNFSNYDITSISDMGLCGEVNNMDETKIYGVMPYVAPEVLRGKSYTQAADIYSFGMIMYFVATGKQPFANRSHDKLLAFDIVHKEIRPEINESEVPKCYIDLMKKCWDSNPMNRPSATEIDELISSFRNNFIAGKGEQFKELEISIENNQSTTHSQAIYTSRLLNSFTECLDCAIIDLIKVRINK